MTLSQIFRSTLGQAPDGYVAVKTLADDVRHVDIYRGPEGDLLVAFGPTRGNLYVEPNETWGHFWAQGKDWLQNFRAWKKSLTVGSKVYQAHAGFVSEYVGLRDVIFAQIKVYQPGKITLTGFSQGAAHATLCHRDLLHNFPAIRVSTTVFASPKVYGMSGQIEFDGRAANKIGYDFERIEVYGDPVVKLAPWWLNYWHVGPVSRLGNPKQGQDFNKCHAPEAYLAVLEGK
jgi:hypothetical protein